MPWYFYVLLALGPVAVIAFFLALHLILRVTGIRGYAPGWQVRCTHCGNTRDAGEVGVIKIGAASVGKLSATFGFCSHCRGFRWIAVERKLKPADKRRRTAGGRLTWLTA